MSTIDVSKIVNKVVFQVDNNSYKKALTAIRKVASEWNKVASKVNNPMAQGRAIGGGGRGSPRTPRVSPADRAQEVISAGNIRRQSMYGTGGADRMAGTINSLNSQLKSGAISLQVYRQQVAAVEREFRRAQASATTFGDNLKGLRTAFIALTAGNVLFTGGRAVMQTGQMFQGIEAAMSMTSDGASETASKMQYLREEAYRLGLDLKIASQGFVQLSVSANKILSGSQTQELFTGMSEYATALGLDAFRYEKALLGFTQIANKGQLMAEEVKNQIGEQLPGALDLFVAAASEFTGKELTTPEFFKMMQDGELLAKDILPLMGKMMSAAAKKGGALEKMLLSNGVAMRRLTQTWQNFQNEFFKGGFGQSMTDTFNVLAQMLKDNTGLAGQLGKAFKAVMDNLLDGFTLAYDIARMFWWEMDDALFSKIPEGMKTWLGDMAAIIAAVLIATGVFRGLYGLLKMIFGMGSLPKSLGLGKNTGKISTTMGKVPLVGQALAFSAAVAGPINDMLRDSFPGYKDFDSSFTSFLTEPFAKGEMRTDLRPSLRIPTSLPSTQNPQDTNVKDVNLDLNIKVDEGMLKDIIDVQIKNDQQKIFNIIYQE